MSRSLKEEPAVDYLFDAILCLKNREECYRLFDDICTVKEVFSIAQRLEVYKMLRDNKTYLEITEKTGASAATISRVNRFLNYENSALDMVCDRLEDNKK